MTHAKCNTKPVQHKPHRFCCCHTLVPAQGYDVHHRSRQDNLSLSQVQARLGCTILILPSPGNRVSAHAGQLTSPFDLCVPDLEVFGRNFINTGGKFACQTIVRLTGNIFASPANLVPLETVLQRTVPNLWL